MSRRTIFIALAAALGTAVVVRLSGFSLGGACGNEMLREVPSPGGHYRVVVFQRDCGATTGFSTQVSVLPEGGRLDGAPGNVLIADTDHGRAPAGPGGGPEIRILWLGPTHLAISRHHQARVFFEATAAGDVRVEHGQFSQ